MDGRLGRAAFWVVVASIALSASGRASFAQATIDPPTSPGAQPRVPLLQFRVNDAIKAGKVAAVRGAVGGDGLRFALGSLSILQPVVISLIAANPGDDLTLTLFKKDWKEPRRTGTTGTDGSVAFSFRTEGGVNVLVQSRGPSRPFYLVAWAGEEVRPASMKDVIVTPAQFKAAGHAKAGSGAAETGGMVLPAKAGTGGWSLSLGWLVAGGLSIVVVVLGGVVLRRTRK